MNIVVIGAGFAGVWAAAAAARERETRGLTAADLTITVIAPGPSLVIRPRLYEPRPQDMQLALDRILGPVDVQHLAATVTAIDHQNHLVRTVGTDGTEGSVPYDRLVLAAGSQLRTPPALPGSEWLRSVDTMEDAVALDHHLHTLPASDQHEGRYTAVVIGAGFTGVEAATELVGRLQEIAGPAADQVRVVVVERADQVGPELGDGPRPYVQQALSGLGVEVRLAAAVDLVDGTGVVLADGERIDAQTVVWTAGMAASPLTAQLPVQLDRLGRLPVDPFLQVVGVRDVFAAGDTAAAWADDDNQVVQSCQHAIPQGKCAGHNAVASLLSAPLAPFRANPYVTCIDLGAWGAVFTKGWDRQVDLIGSDGKARKQLINGNRIYPPVDDRAEIIRQADMNVTTRSTVDATAF